MAECIIAIVKSGTTHFEDMARSLIEQNDAPKRILKIALIIPTLDQGGAEKQLVLLATQINRDLFEPHVITLTRNGRYLPTLMDAGIPVHEIHKRGKFDPFALRRLINLLGSLKPDIVHTWIFAANAYGRYAALKAGVPVILGGERCVDPWKRGWQFAIDRYLAKRTTGILTNSSGIRDFYASKGIAKDRFTIIPNGIEPSNQPFVPRDEALKRLNLPAHCRLIGSVGRLWIQKGYKDLIWTASMLTQVQPNLHYVVIGDGPQRSMLEQFRDDIGSIATIRLLGHLDDVADLMPHFDLFWNGSLYEGQSNSIMEAMRAGAPVIATDIPGNRDLIDHDVHGFLYPYGAADQLAKLSCQILDDALLRSRLVGNAKSRIANEFSIEKMVHLHEQTYLAKLGRKNDVTDLHKSQASS